LEEDEEEKIWLPLQKSDPTALMQELSTGGIELETDEVMAQ
jgi:hypothetical protein